MKLFGNGAVGSSKKVTDAITLSEDDLLDELVRRQMQNQFPMDIFPAKLHNWIQFLTVDMGLEQCFVGLSMMQAMSIALGSGLRGKMGMMEEKPALYGVLVGYTSSGKSISLDMCMKPIVKIQHDLDAQNDEEPLEDSKFQNFEDTKALYVKDATFDAFVRLLVGNPKGVTRYYDEFYAYFVDIERLKVNAGEITFWTEKWNSNAEHRLKRSSKKSFTIPSQTLFCNLFGGTQPDFLKYFFTKGKLEQGYSWRFLYAIQPKYNIAEIDPYMDFNKDAYNAYEQCILKAYEATKVFTHGRKPEVIAFDKHGTDIYEVWRRRARAEVDACDDVLIKNAKAGIYGKMKQYVIRFAVILKAMHECSEYGEPRFIKIEEEYVRKATRLADYFMKSNFLAYQIVYESLIVPADVLRLVNVLKKNAWNQTKTADELEISRTTLIRYIKKYGKMYPHLFGTREE